MKLHVHSRNILARKGIRRVRYEEACLAQEISFKA